VSRDPVAGPAVKAQLGPGKPGRPPKFGRRGQLVAVTLPNEIVQGLRKLDLDLAWAIVKLFEKNSKSRKGPRQVPDDAALVAVGGGRSLIVVSREVFQDLPGVNLIPLDGQRAFLALEPGRGMSDLELAVIDRLAIASVGRAEREGLKRLRALLSQWRRDKALRCETRAIIVLRRRRRVEKRAASRSAADEEPHATSRHSS
jgi:hypothetical protein